MRDWLAKFMRKTDSSRDIAQLMSSVAVPSVQIVLASKPTRSHLGGRPTVNLGSEPPMLNGEPIPLVAQLDLEEISACRVFDWLPKIGTLLFFYDYKSQSAWGFDPKDREAFSVVYVNSRAEPTLHEVKVAKSGDMRTINVEFEEKQSFPSEERKQVRSLNLNDLEFEKWIELDYAAFNGKPRHQIGGFPTNIQGDSMELECQLVSNGIYCGGPEGYAGPRVANLSAGQSDWRLLLQIDTDEEDLNVMWGDVGQLYFWVRQQDSSKGQFQNAWTILQCH
jgi:uncharacterized protein YwqG